MVGKKKRMVLAYDDDLAMVAKTEEDMISMMNRFKKYVNKKKLALNANRYKMIVFKKG